MHKMHFQINTGFNDLLQSKKKVYGHKYDKNNKSNFKPSPATTSIFSQTKRPFKTQSSQKNRQKSHNSKKKRVNTQTADQKLHQSLCVQMGRQQHQAHHATKSLFYGENKQFSNEKDIQQIGRWASIFNRQQPKQQLKKKKKNSVQINKGFQELTYASFSSLKICDIQSLINLIDNCVIEANQYICYLSLKVEDLKKELLRVNNLNAQMQNQLKTRVDLNEKKDKLIKALQSELQITKMKHSQPVFQIKKLLEVINKLSEQNFKQKKYIESNKHVFEGYRNYWKQKSAKEKKTVQDLDKNSFNDQQRNADEIQDKYPNQFRTKIQSFNIEKQIKKIDYQISSPQRTLTEQKKHKYIKQKINK